MPRADDMSSSEYSSAYSHDEDEEDEVGHLSPDAQHFAQGGSTSHQDHDASNGGSEQRHRLSNKQSDSAGVDEEENEYFPRSDDEVPRGHMNQSLSTPQAQSPDDQGSMSAPEDGRLGKKGLPNIEMSMHPHHDTTSSSYSDDENDHDDDQNMRATSHAHQEENGPEDSQSDDDHYHSPQHGRSKTKPMPSLWSKYDPIVEEVANMLVERNTSINQLGYARLASAGRGTVDYIVRKRSIIIGRMESSVDCHIRSDSRFVSKKHAKLEWNDNREEWLLECISAKNCIVVNGVPVVHGSTPFPLKSRDLVEIGDVSFYFLAATTPVYHINDIAELEKIIERVRSQEDDMHPPEPRPERIRSSHYDDTDSRNDRLSQVGSRRMGRTSRKMRGSESSHAHELEHGKRKKTRKGKRKGSSGGTTSHWKEEKRSKSRGGRSSRGGAVRDTNRKSSKASHAASTDDEEEEQVKTTVKRVEVDDIVADGKGVMGGGQLMSNYNSRLKASGAVEEEDSSSKGSKYKEEWTKKEHSDFCRSLFAVGVDPILAEDGTIEQYNWQRFRKIEELPKKSDLMLEDYWIRVMTDVRALLEEEEIEKRTKGPRTKHKPGCDCIVCENTRKSRRKKRQEREGAKGGEATESEEEEEDGFKSTARTSDRLVGLVTAQKLRVRLGIHDALSQLKTPAGVAVLEKLQKHRNNHPRDFPDWWRPGHHDKELMRGSRIHGVGQWSDIWNDPRLKGFRRMKERHGSSVIWPSNQAAMKRLRELSSSINAERRKEAKRATRRAWLESTSGTIERSTKKDNKRSAGRPVAERSTKRRKTKQDAGPTARDDHEIGTQSEIGEESGDQESMQGRATPYGGVDAANVETEDEDEVQLEVEEEMEIEVDEDGMATEDDDEGDDKPLTGPSSSFAGKQPVGPMIPAGEVSTDDEEEEEQGGLETASETESEQ